jgi:8-oxo-dGTP pyrophosphatase MutT (NUDIX family)
VTPEQLAEVTADSEHKRLIGELRSLAVMVERLPIAVFAGPEVLAAARELHEELGVKIEAAERQGQIGT